MKPEKPQKATNAATCSEKTFVKLLDKVSPEVPARKAAKAKATKPAKAAKKKPSVAKPMEGGRRGKEKGKK